jgi:hypothetical protein
MIASSEDSCNYTCSQKLVQGLSRAEDPEMGFLQLYNQSINIATGFMKS